MSYKQYINYDLSIIYRSFLALFLFIFFAGLLFTGMKVSPDSFRYMEGAMNLINGKGFVTNCNSLPMTYFQPGYSVFMIPFLRLVGFNGTSVLLANCILFLSAGFCFYTISKKRIIIKNYLVYSLIIFLLFSTLFEYYIYVLSENLNYIFIFFYYYIIFKKKSLKGYKRIGALFLVEIAMIATRNQSILLILPYHIITSAFLFYKFRFCFSKYLSSLLHFIILIVSFLLIRKALGDNMHSLGFGLGMYHWYEYVQQIIIDISYFFLGYSFIFKFQLSVLALVTGIVIILSAVINVRMKREVLIYLLSALILHIIIFSNLWIDAELNGRFLGWMYILIFFFSDLRIVKFQNNLISKRITIVLLFIFAAGKSIDVFLIVKPNYKAIINKDIPFNSYIYYYYKLSNSAIKSRIEFPATVVKDSKGAYILTAPCYPWDMK